MCGFAARPALRAGSSLVVLEFNKRKIVSSPNATKPILNKAFPRILKWRGPVGIPEAYCMVPNVM